MSAQPGSASSQCTWATKCDRTQPTRPARASSTTAYTVQRVFTAALRGTRPLGQGRERSYTGRVSPQKTFTPFSVNSFSQTHVLAFLFNILNQTFSKYLFSIFVLNHNQREVRWMYRSLAMSLFGQLYKTDRT